MCFLTNLHIFLLLVFFSFLLHSNRTDLDSMACDRAVSVVSTNWDKPRRIIIAFRLSRLVTSTRCHFDLVSVWGNGLFSANGVNVRWELPKHSAANWFRHQNGTDVWVNHLFMRWTNANNFHSKNHINVYVYTHLRRSLHGHRDRN